MGFRRLMADPRSTARPSVLRLYRLLGCRGALRGGAVAVSFDRFLLPVCSPGGAAAMCEHAAAEAHGIHQGSTA
jgi:hypothetical protein